MEVALSPQVQKPNLQTTGRKISCTGSQKDLWLVVREGSLSDVELALASLKKSGGNINLRNTFGLTPLHIATWRNHIPIVGRLLAAGADPDARVWQFSFLHFLVGHLFAYPYPFEALVLLLHLYFVLKSQDHRDGCLFVIPCDDHSMFILITSAHQMVNGC